MPYRNYYGGIDPSDLQQAAQGNPWYNPMSKYPDIGGGIRSLLNQMLMMKQLKEQKKKEEEQGAAAQKQREFENSMKRREFLQKTDEMRQRYELAQDKATQPEQPKFDPKFVTLLEKKFKLPQGSLAGMTPDVLKETFGDYRKGIADEAKEAAKATQDNRGTKLRTYYQELSKLSVEYMKEKSTIEQAAIKESIKDQADALKGGDPTAHQATVFRKTAQRKKALSDLDARNQVKLDALRKKYAEWLPQEAPPPPPGFVLDQK